MDDVVRSLSEKVVTFLETGTGQLIQAVERVVQLDVAGMGEAGLGRQVAWGG
jgi:hypothetical protein